MRIVLRNIYKPHILSVNYLRGAKMIKGVVAGMILLMFVLAACENVDLSKVNKADIDKVIVCNDPYMRFAFGCCLDKDKNKICDNDQIIDPSIPANQDSNSGSQNAVPPNANNNPATLPPAKEFMQIKIIKSNKQESTIACSTDQDCANSLNLSQYTEE